MKRYGVSALYQAKEKTEKVGKTESAETARSPLRETKPAAPSRIESKPVAEKTEERPDRTGEILSSLDEVTRQVFAAMPTDRAVSPDGIDANGASIGEVITALTLLELSGLVSSLPGGLYQRN